MLEPIVEASSSIVVPPMVVPSAAILYFVYSFPIQNSKTEKCLTIGSVSLVHLSVPEDIERSTEEKHEKHAHDISKPASRSALLGDLLTSM